MERSPLDVKLIALSIVLSSLLDAWLTLVHLREGGSELNPLMAMALQHGIPTFVLAKMGLTGAGVWYLTAYQHVSLASGGLRGIALLYGVLLSYQAMLFLS